MRREGRFPIPLFGHNSNNQIHTQLAYATLLLPRIRLLVALLAMLLCSTTRASTSGNGPTQALRMV